ncbi:hypothetical protein FL857_11000 [Criibacterium bergeronii]|uniref:Deoxyribonuclease NucA/NucB domain-containing protein n=2 Tax=Criibacterium bergeronii TaxID=1871336 RepID=A0A552UWU8_9FIRM|nr:hypothetical protein FL857_11000 [Criibacterium bergeronii]
MTGEAKPLGEAIKEMAIGAVTGAIGGALPGSTAVWIGIGGGIEGTVDRFLRGEKTTAGNIMQDIFLSMATAGILDNVARKIKKAGAYKVVKEKIEKTTKEVGERLDRKVKEILEPVLDTFKPRQELVTPEGIVFSTRNIDNTIENKSMLSRVKNIVTGTGEKGVEKVGKESKAFLGDAEEIASKALGKGDVIEVEISRKKYPESAKHIEDAIVNGHPDVLTIDRGGAKSNRKASLKGIDKIPGKDLDEYPPAMFEEGGNGASVRPINPSDNRGAGATLGHKLRPYSDGTKIKCKITDD